MSLVYLFYCWLVRLLYVLLGILALCHICCKFDEGKLYTAKPDYFNEYSRVSFPFLQPLPLSM